MPEYAGVGESMITIQSKRIVVSQLLHCGIDEAWKVITDTRQWVDWGPSVSRVKCAQRYIQPSSIGSIRTVFGFWVPFTITVYEDPHFWSWRIGRFEATGHRLTVIDEKTCRLSFDLPWWVFPYAVICLVALGRISRICSASAGKG